MKSIGIVGLPNVGKSSLFNLITDQSVPAENYPFCTIDKNVGVIEYKDKRLLKLAKVLGSKEIFPATIQFTDIAGLVKGASKGEGLGNQFLSHIREVDLIMYILRGFIDPNVSHVSKDLDPSNDLDIVLTELILKDIESIDKKLDVLAKQAKSKDRDKVLPVIKELELVKLRLEQGFTVFKYLQNNPKSKAKDVLDSLFLLTAKPAIFIINMSYVELDDKEYEQKLNSWINNLKEYITQKYGEDSANFIGKIDTKFLAEVKDLEDTEKQEFIASLKEFYDTNNIISLAKDRLDLINFFVGGDKDSRSWFLKKGSNIVKAASKIHTDLATNFVKAEVCNVEDIINLGSFNAVKDQGKVRTVGKDYIVQDGDYVIILATK